MVYRTLNKLSLLTCFLSATAWGGLSLPQTTYTVPADELLPVPATLPVPHASLEEAGSRIRLQYQLPKELDGASPRLFTLEGNAEGEQFDLEGDGLNADCVTSSEVTSCTIHYDEIQLNHAAADDFLAKNIQDQALVQRLQTARQVLEHQAVGILTFKRP